VARPGPLDLVREKECALDQAKVIPAPKVFAVAIPVEEVAAQVLRDQASWVPRRENVASIAP